jgi:Co/Zn/Cd efflux system component
VERTIFDIPKMDCASEERLVRMALQDVPVRHLEFDLSNRKLTVLHDSAADGILERLIPLNFGARIEETHTAESEPVPASDNSAAERSTLMILLAINAVMFAVELVAGWLAESTGLIADSLDMFADAAVYGVSLYAIRKAASMQMHAARLSGYLELLLALGALGEVVRRFVMGSEPEPSMIMGIALLALVANVVCMALLSKHREGGVHMKASWIFSTNDVIANLGVIAAGALVAWTSSAIPDLVIGTIIGLVVLSGAMRILRLSRRRTLSIE